MSDLRDDLREILGRHLRLEDREDDIIILGEAEAVEAILANPAIASALAGREAVIEQCVEAVRTRFTYEDEGGGWRRQTSLEEVTEVIRALKTGAAITAKEET